MAVPRGVVPSRPIPGLLATLEVLPWQVRLVTGALLLAMGVAGILLGSTFYSFVLLGAGVMFGLPLLLGALGDRRRSQQAAAELVRARAELAELRDVVLRARADRRSVGALLRERGYESLAVQRWIARECGVVLPSGER